MVEEIQNIVLVIVDALRRNSVSVFESDRSLTPNIEEIAARGTVFKNAFSCTNTTDPSVTSIHTGKDPETVVKHQGPFVTDEEKRRAENVQTVPEVLQEHGYSTLVTGRTLSRWHKSGFDYYPEPALGRYKRQAIGEQLDRINPLFRKVAGEIYERLSSVRSIRGTDEIDEFLDVIDEEPFYGMIHMMDTHVPYSHDERLVDELLEEYNYPNEDLNAFFRQNSSNDYISETMREYSDEKDYRDGLARWFAKYDAAVAKADQKIGKLLDGLRNRDLAEETVVIITSDHGESLDEHGIYFEHHGLYEPEIRVPLLIGGPSIPRDRRDELVQLYDLAPTILDMSSAPTRLQCDGRSLLPLLGGEGSWKKREYIVAQEAHAQSRRAIRSREFKFIKHVEDQVLEEQRGNSFRCGYCDIVHGDKHELFDLRQDQEEVDDVSQEHPERAAYLEEQLDSYFRELDYPDSGSEEIEYEAEDKVLDRLEDLGYR